MLRDLFRLLAASLGLVKDASEAAIKGYLGLLRKLAAPSMMALVVVVVLALAAQASHWKAFNVLAVLVAGLVVAAWIVATLPILAVGRTVAEFEPLKWPFRVTQYVVGTAFLLALLAALLPADSTGLSRLTLVALALSGSLVVFGLTRSFELLAVKLTAIMILVFLATVLPGSASVAPGLLVDLDNGIRNLFSRTAAELVLNEEKLQTGPFWDRRGDPLYWCRPAEDRGWGYRCYSRPGRDPATNELLVGISPEIVKDAARRLKAPGPMRAAISAPDGAWSQAPTAKTGDRPAPAMSFSGDAELLTQTPRSLQPYVTSQAKDSYLAVVIARERSFDRELMLDVSASVQPSGRGHVSVDTFSEMLIADGVLDQLLRDDPNLVGSLQEAVPANYLLLGRASVGYEPNRVVGAAQNADLVIQMRLIDGRTGALVGERRFTAAGLGYSEADALADARAQSVPDITQWVMTHTSAR